MCVLLPAVDALEDVLLRLGLCPGRERVEPNRLGRGQRGAERGVWSPITVRVYLIAELEGTVAEVQPRGDEEAVEHVAHRRRVRPQHQDRRGPGRRVPSLVEHRRHVADDRQQAVELGGSGRE